MDNKEINKLFNDAVYHYENYDYKSALKEVTNLLQIDDKHIQGRTLKAMILVESWDGLNSTKNEISEAIDHYNMLMEKDPSKKWRYIGNKGNAIRNLALAKLKENRGELNKEIIEKFEEAKDCYQESLELNENQPHIWVNKGNILDEYLGRYLDALECYDRAILNDKQYENAWGNRGLCLGHLSELVDHEGDKQLLFNDAMVYIGIELKFNPNFQIDESFKEEVREFLQKNNIEIDLEKTLKEQLPKKMIYTDYDFNLYGTFDKNFEEFYYSFCEKEGFFLNVHFDCKNCSQSSLDLLSVHIISKIEDYKTPYNLITNLNNLIADYKTARFLLALSQYRHPEFLFLDKRQDELLDYSLNYVVNVELLKEAFIKIINICDKIAFFLKDYEKLVKNDGNKLKDSKIYFFGGGNSIFEQTKIIEENNYQIDIVAMNSIRKDLEKGEFERLKGIRNFLTHRYVVLHEVGVKRLMYPCDLKPLENLEYHEEINEFYKLSKKAVRLVRNMLFSLHFFVNQKEKKKMGRTTQKLKFNSKKNV